jgi:hypothetical protein
LGFKMQPADICGLVVIGLSVLGCLVVASQRACEAFAKLSERSQYIVALAVVCCLFAMLFITWYLDDQTDLVCTGFLLVLMVGYCVIFIYRILELSPPRAPPSEFLVAPLLDVRFECAVQRLHRGEDACSAPAR